MANDKHKALEIQNHDTECNQLFKQLETLKARGEGGKVASVEYLETLKALQLATRARLGAIRVVSL